MKWLKSNEYNFRVSSKARFHVKVRTQFNKFVFYFIVRHNENFGVPNANSGTNFDVKSGLRVDPT